MTRRPRGNRQREREEGLTHAHNTMPCPCSSMNAKQREASTSSMRSRATVDRARDGGPRGWVHYATYLSTVCTVWGGKIGTTGETPGSHVLEAAEDGQCDGRGVRKNKKASCRSHSREGRKKGGPGHGAPLHQGAASHGTWGHSAGYLVLYRLHSVAHTVHTRTRAALRHLKGTTQLQFFC